MRRIETEGLSCLAGIAPGSPHELAAIHGRSVAPKGAIINTGSLPARDLTAAKGMVRPDRLGRE